MKLYMRNPISHEVKAVAKSEADALRRYQWEQVSKADYDEYRLALAQIAAKRITGLRVH